jgi:hypothetical protein
MCVVIYDLTSPEDRYMFIRASFLESNLFRLPSIRRALIFTRGLLLIALMDGT